MGFPTQYFTVLFAVPRVAGYLAHWRESLADPETKIIRPQQDYKVGGFAAAPVASHVVGRGWEHLPSWGPISTSLGITGRWVWLIGEAGVSVRGTFFGGACKVNGRDRAGLDGGHA